MAVLDGTIPAFARTLTSMSARWPSEKHDLAFFLSSSSLAVPQRCATHRISIQGLEKVNDYLEEGNGFLPGLIAGIARRLEGRDTSAMGRPLVLPEGLGALGVAEPVGLHEREERGGAVRIDELS